MSPCISSGAGRFAHQTVVATLLATALTVVTACGPIRQHRPVPEELSDTARIPGFDEIRTWGDRTSDAHRDDFIESVRQQREHTQRTGGDPPKTVDVLALSGGGEHGAYGVGLLCAWTDRGDRPDFRLVTGISTGALIAPFVFAGPEYDDLLENAYTTITKDDIFSRRSILALLRNDGFASTEPLAELIDRAVDEGLLDHIAAEHARGRRLLIATTNLDAQRPVIWNMGAIAASDHPDAPQLFEDIMRASASIPGAFSPVYFKVIADDGVTYEEMHVDGGVVSQVFLWGSGLELDDIVEGSGSDVSRTPIRLFVIRNGRFDPVFAELRPLVADIAGRAISTLIKAQGLGDVYRLHSRAARSGMEFNLAWIPAEFQEHPAQPFDQEYMRALFQHGYDLMINGDPWHDRPPFAPPD